MENIEELLRQAKPFYIRRKRNRRFVVGMSVFAPCLVAAMVAFHSPEQNQNILYDFWEDEIYQAENGSIIEDFGLPVDEYGLLKVG